MKKLPSNRRLLWQFFFGCYCVGLDRLLPIGAVTCLDDGSDLDLITRETGIRFCTVEHPAVRERWIGAGIDAVVERRAQELERVLSTRPAAGWFVTSSPASRLLESFCRDRGLTYLGSKADSARRFQGKSALHSALRQTGLPLTKGRWVAPSGLCYSELRQAFGDRFVAQKERGGAGSGTILITSQETTDALPGPPEDVYISPYLGDLSFNINASIVGRQVCVGFPSVQLSGVRETGVPWGGYCGNDYSAACEFDHCLIEVLQENTERIGDWLAAEGFEGLFGLDFVIGESDGVPYVVDLNPRWQGSTAVSTQAEQAAGRLPLAAAQLAFELGAVSETEVRNLLGQFRQPLRASQLCLRFSGTAPRVVDSIVEPGIYRAGEAMAFSRPGIRLGDCLSSDEFLLTCGAPRRGTLVMPGAWLVRLYSNKSVCGGSSSQLTAKAGQIARQAYELFGLPPA